MRTWRVTVKAPETYRGPAPREYVDYYAAETEAEARALSDEDAHRYGLPPDTQFTFEEVPSGSVKSPQPEMAEELLQALKLLRQSITPDMRLVLSDEVKTAVLAVVDRTIAKASGPQIG